MQFGKFLADNLAKTGKLPANREEGQAALNALAHELARAGYPASVAQRTILETATQGSIKAGYGPNSNYNLLGHVTRAINEMAAQAMQGYRAGKTPEVQGPPAPAQQRSEAFRGVTPAGFFGPATRPGALDRPTGVSPVEEEMQFQGLAKDPSAQEMIEQFSPAPGDRHASSLQAPSLLQLVAGGRDAGQPPAVEPGQLPGRNEWESSRPGLPLGFDPNVLIENPDFSPPAPPPAFQAPSINDRGIAPDTFMMQQQEQQEYQQNLDPRGQRQASLLDFLSNLNPISTAEARGGRSQAGRLTAPQADPGVIQGRLAEARSNIINDLQNNQGLRNTLDLVAAGEVGSQGKAAVLAFLETAMNKVAAEASRQGREATGRDLLNYLNSRTYFPDTWGKIESGKVKGGAVTDDLLDAVAQGSNTTKGSTGNSSVKSPGSRFGGNPTNATIGGEHYGVENYSHHIGWYNALGAPPAGRGIGSDFAADPQDMPAAAAVPPAGLLDSLSTGR
jgi:hypothetical protein